MSPNPTAPDQPADRPTALPEPAQHPAHHRSAGRAGAASPLAARVLARYRRPVPPEEPPPPPPIEADAGDLNRIHLTGRLGSTPLLTSVGDHPHANLALATERRWRAADGSLRHETSWFNLSAWEELADYCGRHLRRGDRVYVEGCLHLWMEQHNPCSITHHAIRVDRIVRLADGSAGVAIVPVPKP